MRLPALAECWLEQAGTVSTPTPALSAAALGCTPKPAAAEAAAFVAAAAAHQTLLQVVAGWAGGVQSPKGLCLNCAALSWARLHHLAELMLMQKQLEAAASQLNW
jgi:hypothetical protein